MNIDEVIDALSKIRAERGNIPVFVHDGCDSPGSALCPVKLIEVGPETFFNFQTYQLVEGILVVSLLTGQVSVAY